MCFSAPEVSRKRRSFNPSGNTCLHAFYFSFYRIFTPEPERGMTGDTGKAGVNPRPRIPGIPRFPPRPYSCNAA